MRKRRSETLRASEIGEYVFCARAWRLRLDGYEPTGESVRLVAGQRFHERHGRSLQRTRRLNVVAFICFALAVVVALIWLLRWGR
jgi:hypothetical protein